MRRILIVGLVVGLLGSVTAADGQQANTWVKVTAKQTGPRSSPGVVWCGPLKRFVLFGGSVTHAFKGERPYDVQGFDPAKGQWFNHLPQAATGRGGETGNVTHPGYKTPYFAMVDKAKLLAPNPRHVRLWYQYALAPWDGRVYALVCGRTLRYDPAGREWKDLKPETSPAPPGRTWKGSLCWGAMCADESNKEIVLFGGCGLKTRRAGPGTWVYSTEKNTWRKLALDTQPPVRALSPMAYDAAARKIVLFGGERLDQLYADTWVYDCKTRTWAQKKPAVSPSPRFGHGLLWLPKSRRIVLIGGKGYSSSTSYCAMMYTILPFEMWTYDLEANEWKLIRRLPKGGPRQHPTEAMVAAAGPDDTVLLNAAARRYERETWTCRIDPAVTDAVGAAKWGVKPGALVKRTGPFDPAWYAEGVPAPDPKAAAKVLAGLAANKWVALKCPKWPANRQGGGWSTVALDTDGDRILHLGGGHSSYFGNDLAIYDIAAGRWSISWAPQFALEFNYDLSGPGPWAFNGGPWGNHNYHAYCYDPASKRLVYMRGGTNFYDPVRNAWQFDEWLKAPFTVTKYTTHVTPTPKGVVAWTHVGNMYIRPMGMYRLEGGRKWVKLPVKGGKLPVTVTDSSAAVYDSKRDRLLMTTSGRGKQPQPAGQVWAYDFASGEVKMLDPAGKDAIKTTRFAREAVYLPQADWMLMGCLLKRDGRSVTPIYDCAANRWLTAEIPGSKFIGRKGAGMSVDLGLKYDPKRDLVWGVLCKLRQTGALNVLRVDPAALAARPLK